MAVHCDSKAYKPLVWMSPPCTTKEEDSRWVVTSKTGERLLVTFHEVLHDSAHDLGAEPGLVKDGVEAQLQKLLAESPSSLEPGLVLVRREYPTPIGPVDILCRDSAGRSVAVEVKRKADIQGVEQLTRYLECLRRDPLLGTVRGILAAQDVRPQARSLAGDRGIECVVVDYQALRGLDPAIPTLF